MDCENCGQKNLESLMILPIHRPTGELCSIFCPECGVKSSAYCLKHHLIHWGFVDGSTACRDCIEEQVSTLIPSLGSLLEEIVKIITTEEHGLLMDSLALGSVITGDKISVSLIRFVVSRAERERVSIQTIVNRIKKERSVGCILS